ncbi:MAG: CHASE2 domain-containing protein [Leptolyngbya sp. SIO4C1]|nr:CHASE2 domain-containing protein [Leptolyngbya sp. SIO4C1]
MRGKATVPEKLAVLKLEGDFEHQGFRVALEVGLEGQRATVEQMGELPPAPQLLAQLAQWQTSYGTLSTLTRAISPQAIVYEGTLQQHIGDCRQQGRRLAQDFLAWLNTDSFKTLELFLREELSRQDQIRVLVRSQNRHIQQLPWHLWGFIDRYPHSEVVFGALSAEPPLVDGANRTPAVRILAILGDRTGLNLDVDRQLLAAIPNAALTFLVEPERTELQAHLWEKSWDILFFAGHSETRQETGQLFINSTETLPLNELKYALRQTVSRGLQLAIFNSCDGLGLAHELAQVQLPQMIVMREPVPDFVAQEFLKAFLAAFSTGESLYLAERQAREQLQGLEKQFPYASWLPVIVQNPAVEPLTWQQLLSLETPQLTVSSDEPVTAEIPTWTAQQKHRWHQVDIKTAIKRVALTAVLVTSLVIGVRSLGLLQIPELKAYDRLTQLRPQAGADERLLVITVDENDIAYQDFRKMNRTGNWSLSDQALEQLLRTIKPYRPAAVGLDIYHPYSFEPALAQLIADTESFVGICEMDHPYSSPDNNMPPPNINGDRLGFSDLAIDPDNRVRRQILLMTAGEVCNTSQSFSLQIAEQYLAEQNYASNDLNNIKRLSNGQRQLGDFIFPRLQFNSGSYQLPPQEAAGYQILINTRYELPQPIALREFLDEATQMNLPKLITDRIVLIGVNQRDQDRHFIAPNSIDSTPGVMIHAHMTSQLLDAVLKQKGIMHWWPEWLEMLWIFAWALFAAGWASLKVSKLWLGIGIAAIILSLFLTCFIFFCFNIWIPLIPSVFAVMIGAVATLFSQRKSANVRSSRA